MTLVKATEASSYTTHDPEFGGNWLGLKNPGALLKKKYDGAIVIEGEMSVLQRIALRIAGFSIRSKPSIEDQLKPTPKAGMLHTIQAKSL